MSPRQAWSCCSCTRSLNARLPFAVRWAQLPLPRLYCCSPQGHVAKLEQFAHAEQLEQGAPVREYERTESNIACQQLISNPRQRCRTWSCKRWVVYRFVEQYPVAYGLVGRVVAGQLLLQHSFLRAGGDCYHLCWSLCRSPHRPYSRCSEPRTTVPQSCHSLPSKPMMAETETLSGAAPTHININTNDRRRGLLRCCSAVAAERCSRD